jgi:hypothetical protein
VRHRWFGAELTETAAPLVANSAEIKPPLLEVMLEMPVEKKH